MMSLRLIPIILATLTLGLAPVASADNGTITDIVLTDPFYGGTIDPKLFEFKDYGERERSGD